MSGLASEVALESAQHRSRLRKAWYATAVLMLAYTFSFLDRQILNLLVGPIKHDFRLTDVQFALLTGGAFALFYTVMGLPIGWLADRYPRKWIIAIGIALWSLMTATCGLARSFHSLLLARVGVAVGEATLTPSTYSLLADYFDASRLPRAMSLYMIGIYIGAGASTIIGGVTAFAVFQHFVVDLPFVGRIESWHLVFLVVGLPGLLIALWITTLFEPPRKAAIRPTNETSRSSLRCLWEFFSGYPRMAIALFLGSAAFAIMNYMDAWYPELFIRSWGWDVQSTGLVNGMASLTAGPVGMLTAGYVSGRMIRNGQTDACLRLTVYVVTASVVPATLMPLMPNAVLMAAFLWPIKFLGGFVPVLAPSAIQQICPPSIRAQVGAIYIMATGIIGITLGPLLPALLTDHLFHDEHMLRYSLSLAACVVVPLALILLAQGLPQYRGRILALADSRPMAFS
jgi:MFS family permease